MGNRLVSLRNGAGDPHAPVVWCLADPPPAGHHTDATNSLLVATAPDQAGLDSMSGSRARGQVRYPVTLEQSHGWD